MPVPTSINDLSTTADSNSPSGEDSPATLDNHIRALASFIATLRDGAYTGSDAVKLTGSQTIAGTKTFSSTIVGSITGNAATATDAGTLDGIDSTGFTRTTGTSELGTTARTSGNTSAGFSGGVEARNSGTGAGTGTYFNGVLHSVSVGGMEVVDLGSGAAELRFSSTPAGDPNTDRRVTTGKLRSDGIWEGVGFLPSDTGGGIGTYAFCYRVTNATLTFGSTVAGSDLKPTQAGNNSSGGSALTGTWRCLGQSNTSAADQDRKTLYVRIS